MTSVIMIAPLNAANFESGAATDGQVLTADGAGGAAFADAAGGGGASFAWDGAEIVAALDEGNSMNLNVSIQLKNGSQNAAVDAVVQILFSAPVALVVPANIASLDVLILPVGNLLDLRPILVGAATNGLFTITADQSTGVLDDVRVCLLLPNGGIAQSNLVDGWLIAD